MNELFLILFAGFGIGFSILPLLFKKNVIRWSTNPYSGKKEKKVLVDYARVVILFDFIFVCWKTNGIKGALIFFLLFVMAVIPFYQKNRKVGGTVLTEWEYSEDEQKKHKLSPKAVVTERYVYLSSRKTLKIKPDTYDNFKLLGVREIPEGFELTYGCMHIPLWKKKLVVPKNKKTLIQRVLGIGR